MNNIYLYDGTFINLLSLCEYLLSLKIKPFNIKTLDYSPTLFDELIHLDILSNETIIQNIINKFSLDIFNIIYYVYLSTDENKELIIYYFLLNYYKYGHKVINLRRLNCVNKALNLSHYVSRENHRLKGFLRFKELNNNILYAEMEPTNNIIFLLSKHFKQRLKNEYWIIKDNGRNILALYDKKNINFIDGKNFKLNDFTLSSHENDIKNLWQEFYNTIAIKERENEKCRMNFMPKKYWKYIIEMSDELEKSNNR